MALELANYLVRELVCERICHHMPPYVEVGFVYIRRLYATHIVLQLFALTCVGFFCKLFFLFFFFCFYVKDYVITVLVWHRYWWTACGSDLLCMQYSFSSTVLNHSISFFFTLVLPVGWVRIDVSWKVGSHGLVLNLMLELCPNRWAGSTEFMELQFSSFPLQ